MDGIEPNPRESSPPRSGVEMAWDHEPPIPGQTPAVKAVDQYLRLRADAEALAHAVSASLTRDDNCRTCGKPRDIRLLLMCRTCVESGVPIPDTHGEQSPLAAALSEYLAKHPWSDL